MASVAPAEAKEQASPAVAAAVHVETAKAAYEAATSNASIKEGRIANVSSNGTASITMTASQPILDTSTTKTWVSQLVVEDDAVRPCGFPSTVAESAAFRAVSPSGNKALIFIVEPASKGASEKIKIEYWQHDRYVKAIDVSDIHGQPYSFSHTFGGLSWSQDESKVVYVAETKAPSRGTWWSSSKSDLIDGEKYRWDENWGEQHRSVIAPQIFSWAVNSTSAPTAIVKNEEFLKHHSLGQPQWSPDGRHVVYTAWPHGKKKLGLIYCTNRMSMIYVSAVDQNTAPKLVAGSDKISAKSPIFSPDGASLVWIGTEVGGAHRTGSILTSGKWQNDKPGVADVKEVVGLSQDSDEPGLAVMTIPNRCWVSNTKLILSTPKQSFIALVVVDIAACKMQYIETSISGSWEFLDAIREGQFEDCQSMILAYCSSPSMPPTLFLGKVSDGGWFNSKVQVQWQKIFTPTQPAMPVAWEVLKFDTKPAKYEALLVAPKKANNTTPLIVLPHGGPHSVDVVGYSTFKTAFVALGYAVLGVNYRGSLGFSDAGISSLPGKIGTQDVNDVNDAVSKVVSMGKADPEQIVVFGGSHGGFLAAHLSAQFPDRYKSAVLRNPVIDLSSMVSVTDIPDWTYHEAGFTYEGNVGAIPTEVFEKMRDVSPIAKVSSVKAPTMILIGLKDARVPINQGWIWHDALRSLGTESKVYVYPDDHHALSGVECAADTFVNVVCWFKRTV